MLVNKCDIPSVTLDTQIVNQYNKKVPIHTKLTYQPVNMTIHDDNAGIVRHFWQQYYQYYSADSWYGGDNAVPGTLPGFNVNRYQQKTLQKNPQLPINSNPNSPSYNDTTDPQRFGLDSGRTVNLIQSIEIYQFARKTFFMWSLVNPVITSWKTDQLDMSGNRTMNHNVSFAYEGIYFGKGRVRRSQPDGWTDIHYDLNPSPIGGLFGRTDGTLLGPYGLLSDATQFFQDLQDTQVDGAPVDFRDQLRVALQGVKLINQASKLNTAAANAELSNAFQQGLSNIAVSTALGTTGIPGLNVNRLDLTSGSALASSIASSAQTSFPSVPGTGGTLGK